MGNNNFCCAPEEEEDDRTIQQYQKQYDEQEEFLNKLNIPKQRIDKIQVKKSGVGDFDRISLFHFQLINVIGQGSFGKVILVQKKTSQRFYAMKILKKQAIDSKNKYKHTINERNILENANYHFAVNLRYAFQDGSRLYFIMDFINGGELFRKLRKQGPFSEEVSKFYIAEILCAIEYLHRKNILYRDLKPENVLIDSEGHIKMTDFGLAKQLDDNTDQANTICGTPEYLAPEIILRKPYGKQVDYWTVGILLYELLTLRTPFRDKDKKKIFENVLNKPVAMREFFSDEAKSLIKGLLTLDPSKRLGYQNGVEEIKKHPFFDDINWKEIAARKGVPPWKPEINDMKDLKYFDERLLKLDPYARDSQDSMIQSDDDWKFDGFTLDPSKLRTFALTPKKLSQISQINPSSSQLKIDQQNYLLPENGESKSQDNSPKSKTNLDYSNGKQSHSAFHTAVTPSKN